MLLFLVTGQLVPRTESLLKMSPHGRHIISYTSRIYTMQYAYHICKSIGPTVISISLFWAFHMSHKDLGYLGRGGGGGGVHMIFATALSVAVEIYNIRYSGVGISSCTANLYELS